jgi:hypothetical protein
MTAASPAHTTIDINSGGSATSDNLQHCIPNLVTLWNYTIRLPYYVTIERPLSGIGSTTYTYSFQCKSNSFAANIYDCVVNIQKIGGVGGGGSNQTLDEVANEFQLVQVSEDSYLIKCEKLEGKYWLNPSTKILMLCDYFPEKSAWCIRAKSHNDIVALFTLNRSGDNLGYLAPWFFHRPNGDANCFVVRLDADASPRQNGACQWFEFAGHFQSYQQQQLLFAAAAEKYDGVVVNDIYESSTRRAPASTSTAF